MLTNTLEFRIDALFAVTDVNAYERYNRTNYEEIKDITSFKRQIYESDIIDISQGEDGFTVLTLIEDGEKVNIRILETIEEIQTILGRLELMRQDKDIQQYSNKKFRNFEKKSS